MVDLFSLALTHALMALAAWRLLLRDDLDRDPPAAEGAARASGDHDAEDTCPAPAAQPQGAVPRLQRLDRGARDRA